MKKQTWAIGAVVSGGGLQRLLGLVLRCASFSTAALAMALALPAQAENAIQAVSGSIQGGTEVIRIDLTQALTAVPTGFPASATPWDVRRSNSTSETCVRPMWCKPASEPGWCST
jgi:type IV pilus assembly protein PilQ